MQDYYYFNPTPSRVGETQKFCGFLNTIKFYNVGDTIQLDGAECRIESRSRYFAGILFYGYNISKL